MTCQGTWKLVVEDREDGTGTGQLNNWVLELCEEAGFESTCQCDI